MRLSKWHALGNDYLLVEPGELTAPLTPGAVHKLCDYHYGVGSDGLLEITALDGASADVRIWNPDGSTAELSGNGVRIVAAWLERQHGHQRGESAHGCLQRGSSGSSPLFSVGAAGSCLTE